MVDYLLKEAQASAGHPPWEPEQLWFALAQAYPAVNEILSFTRVNYNPVKTHALVTARLQRGPAVEDMRSFLLERVQGGWQITRHNLEVAPLTAEFVNESCVVARGGGRFPQTARSQLRGVYRFTFVATSGAVERVDLDVSPLRRSQAEEEWDWSLKHMLKIRSWSETSFFGTWRRVGGHGVPVDTFGNRLPEMSGHFCATLLP
jgi:hypothetical protein